MSAALQTLADRLRDHALAYPQTTEDHPWGETAIKVKGKVFLFMRTGTKELSFSVKLPQSREFALDMPGTEPTGYGLGKSGWVTAKLHNARQIPAKVILQWIDESFRAVAPKTLLKQL